MDLAEEFKAKHGTLYRRGCPVCTHKDRDEIDKLISGGAPIRTLARFLREKGLMDLTDTWLYKHRDRCL